MRVIGSQFISTRLRFFWEASGKVSKVVAMEISSGLTWGAVLPAN
jgi:hypothetical protein